MRRPPIAAAAFDLDGTLVNTEVLWDAVGEAICARHGQSFTRQTKLAMMGKPGPVSLAILIERHHLPLTVEAAQAHCDEEFARLLPGRLALLPGALEVLSACRERGVPRCIVTSSRRPFVETVLTLLGLGPMFDFAVTGDECPRGKPDPWPYHHAAERFGVDPAAMLVFEDSLAGIESAVAAGAVVVGLPAEDVGLTEHPGVALLATGLDDPAVTRLLTERLPRGRG